MFHVKHFPLYVYIPITQTDDAVVQVIAGMIGPLFGPYIADKRPCSAMCSTAFAPSTDRASGLPPSRANSLGRRRGGSPLPRSQNSYPVFMPAGRRRYAGFMKSRPPSSRIHRPRRAHLRPQADLRERSRNGNKKRSVS